MLGVWPKKQKKKKKKKEFLVTEELECYVKYVPKELGDERAETF